MSRQKATAEFKNFTKGIVTEVSPLNFPDNASIDEDNFVLGRDGIRQRRLGMDLEDDYAVISTTEYPDIFGEVAFSSYSWKNAGGDASRQIAVVQSGTTISFFNSSSSSSLSSGLIVSYPGLASKYKKCSYAVVDGLLVVVTGEKNVLTFVFDVSGISVTYTESILYVRDHFGVEDINPSTGHELGNSSYISERPAVLTQAHTYNLRNQTWSTSKKSEYDPIVDPIEYFYRRGSAYGRANVYPSNADNLNSSLYTDPNDNDDPTTPAFYARTAITDPIAASPAPRGYFIIDATSRGLGRIVSAANNQSQNPELLFPVSALPWDTTPGGPAVVTEFAGRAFYAGFSGELIDGDSRSPRMSSYVLFSNRVSGVSDINKCYQIGDPTSREESDILATDGGFIRVDGAFNISSLISIGKSLLVIAENGVWSISGGSDYGFAADNYSVSKITDHGSVSSGSVVVVDGGVVYWGDDGIYSLAPDQFGSLVATNMSANTIQRLYDSVDTSDKIAANGVYDSYDRKIRWIYQNTLNSVRVTKELIYDVGLQAFYPATIRNGDIEYPRIVSTVEVPPFRVGLSSTDVVAASIPVVVGSDSVTYSTSVVQAGTREVLYVVVLSDAPLQFSFGFYKDTSFVDWNSLGIAVDAPAYLVTGYISGGDNQHNKQVPYVTFFLERTEDGFEDVGGVIQPTNQSSCLVQAQWNWTDSAESGKWGREFQAYKYRRFYMPASSSDPYDTGDRLIVTKNKLRGNGRVLSLHIRTEPLKDCKLLGWSMVWGINNDV